MKRFLFASCVALVATGLYVSNASAQSSSDCCCGSVGTVTGSSSSITIDPVYRRFSYDPTPQMPSQYVGGFVQTQPGVFRTGPAVQNYRRLSYQPAATNHAGRSGNRKELWEYSKGDPRKQQH